MDLGIQGKTALVTGGSRGLGRQSALALAREGCNVAICARGAEALTQTVVDLLVMGVHAVGVQADVATSEGTEKAYRETTAALGPVDVLVNNVGGYTGRDFATADDAAWASTLQLNLFSGIRLIRLCLPTMRQRGWGRIISIASIFGREYGGGLTYMTAKASLIAFSKHLAMEVAGSGVTVNTVAPGSITFPGSNWERFQQNNSKEAVDEFVRHNLPMGRFGWPEPIGATVAFLASAHADLITGDCINVDGGQSRSLI